MFLCETQQMLRNFFKNMLQNFYTGKIIYEAYVYVKVCHPSYQVKYCQHFEVLCTPLKDFIAILLYFKMIILVLLFHICMHPLPKMSLMFYIFISSSFK